MIQPNEFKLQETSMWSFPNRGSWATHKGDYPGNWSPYVARNLILRYSIKNDWILDQFMGGGTTLVEAKLLSRNAIGLDINESSLKKTKANLDFKTESNSKIFAMQGDARNLNSIKNESINLICTHPPYANIIKYNIHNADDISNLNYGEFLNELRKVANEAYRVLKKEGTCAFMIGDIRERGMVVPLGFKALQVFLECGFVTKEIIIKEQHNCSSTKYWKDKKTSFLLLAHEYIFVLKKW